MSTLKIDIRPGDIVDIGNDVTLIMDYKSGKVARLSITAPKEMVIKHKKEPIKNDAFYAAEMGISGA